MKPETILILFAMIAGAGFALLGQYIAHRQHMRKMKRESWARIEAIKAVGDKKKIQP